MPSYKNDQGKWYCSFYYTDFHGNRKKKKKEGFSRKKDADEWERKFIQDSKTTSEISFEEFTERYLNDCKSRLKRSTYAVKENVIKRAITPYFSRFAVNEITPLMIRNWQNEILDKGYKPSYQRELNKHLAGMLSFAEKYYGLTPNPMKNLDKIGAYSKKNLSFWTLDEYRRFQDSYTGYEDYRMAITLLFYTGMRKGELLRLTPRDVDFENNTISVSKTYSTVKGEEYIRPPKTESSIRKIEIFPRLSDALKFFVERTMCEDNQRIFEMGENTINHFLDRYCAKADVPHISVHDLRHSHRALLLSPMINANFMYVMERLGHDNIQTTINTYGHLYEDTKKDAVQKLSVLF